MTHQDEREAFELRTGLLILAIYGAWLTVILLYRSLFWRHALKPIDSPVHPGFGTPAPQPGKAP